jgi:hypothetical protein
VSSWGGETTGKVGAETISALSAELSAPRRKGGKDGRTYQCPDIPLKIALFQASPQKWENKPTIGDLGNLRALDRLQS